MSRTLGSSFQVSSPTQRRPSPAPSNANRRMKPGTRGTTSNAASTTAAVTKIAFNPGRP
jgi:hypothetical protein